MGQNRRKIDKMRLSGSWRGFLAPGGPQSAPQTAFKELWNHFLRVVGAIFFFMVIFEIFMGPNGTWKLEKNDEKSRCFSSDVFDSFFTYFWPLFVHILKAKNHDFCETVIDFDTFKLFKKSAIPEHFQDPFSRHFGPFLGPQKRWKIGVKIWRVEEHQKQQAPGARGAREPGARGSWPGAPGPRRWGPRDFALDKRTSDTRAPPPGTTQVNKN